MARSWHVNIDHFMTTLSYFRPLIHRKMTSKALNEMRAYAHEWKGFCTTYPIAKARQWQIKTLCAIDLLTLSWIDIKFFVFHVLFLFFCFLINIKLLHTFRGLWNSYGRTCFLLNGFSPFLTQSTSTLKGTRVPNFIRFPQPGWAVALINWRTDGHIRQ